jgi:oxepin-CoA hydrolase/3-oxo-5,6-dehydrosuberyl-CoA semialdehyde dehydrogenase
MNCQNYALGKWITGDGEGTPLYHAITGENIGKANSKGLDFNQMMIHARKVGGPVLRKMTFQERGLMLKALALHLHSVKDKFYELSYANGERELSTLTPSLGKSFFLVRARPLFVHESSSD